MKKDNPVFLNIVSIIIGVLVLLVALARGTGYWRSPFDRDQQKTNIIAASIVSTSVENGNLEKEKKYEIDVLPGCNEYYLVLNIGGDSMTLRWEILKALKYFHEKNPDLKIISWSIDKQQLAYITASRVFGLCITCDSR